MRDVLKAVLISFALVFVYSIISFIISLFMFGPMAMTGDRPGFLLAPVSLPSKLFEAVAPDSLYINIISSPLLSVMLRVFYFLCNALLYAVPVFLLLKLFRRKSAD